MSRFLDLLSDLQHATRRLAQQPSFTAAAVTEPGARDRRQHGGVQCRRRHAAAPASLRGCRPPDGRARDVIDLRTGLRLVPQLPRLACADADVRGAGRLATRDVHPCGQSGRGAGDRRSRVVQLLRHPSGGAPARADLRRARGSARWSAGGPARRGPLATAVWRRPERGRAAGDARWRPVHRDRGDSRSRRGRRDSPVCTTMSSCPSASTTTRSSGRGTCTPLR